MIRITKALLWLAYYVAGLTDRQWKLKEVD
jgi:hypothetical protein